MDFIQTSTKLEAHDNNLKVALVLAASASVFFRRPGKVLGLGAAYLAGSRNVPLANHQQALESNRDWQGKLPVDPYPGFFGNSSEAKQATEFFSKTSKAAKEAYQGSSLQKQVDEVIDKIGPS